MQLSAYQLSPSVNFSIEPAPREREWMGTFGGHAYRCLPMVIANQNGWVVRIKDPVTATWNGGLRVQDLSVSGPAGSVQSHFGQAVLTFRIPWLFRTPPGWNIITRGPPNWIKDGAQSLEGVVETDWSVATFTHNWKLTRPGHTVEFVAGEPICFIYPQCRGEVQQWDPVVLPIESDPELHVQYKAWLESRIKFNASLRDAKDWQKHYFTGKSPGGASAPEHETRVVVKPFTFLSVSGYDAPIEHHQSILRHAPVVVGL